VPSQERIFVTPGAHPALLAILGSLAKPGEAILSESITYPGIRSVAAQLRLNLSGLAMDEDGILPDAFADACQRMKPKGAVSQSEIPESDNGDDPPVSPRGDLWRPTARRVLPEDSSDRRPLLSTAPRPSDKGSRSETSRMIEPFARTASRISLSHGVHGVGVAE
jgi:hypothetical protein